MNLILNSLENSDFVLERQGLVVVVKDAAKDVLVLNDGAELLDQVLAHSVQELFEEVVVVVHLEGQAELGLELLPDSVALLDVHVSVQENFFFEDGVKLRSLFVISPQLIAGDVALFIDAPPRDLEKVGLLAVVHEVVVSQFDQEVDLTGGGKMQVVNSSFGHHVQAVVDWGILQLFQLVLEGACADHWVFF